MKPESKQMSYGRLKAIAISSLLLLAITVVTSFLLFYRVQNLSKSQPSVRAYSFYEFCEALAPDSGSIDLTVRRDPLTVIVIVETEKEFLRLQELVTSSMLTTAASIKIRYGKEVFRYAPPAIP